MTQPVKSVDEISGIAYGFIASKVLFAALHIGLFTRLASGPKSIQELSQETQIHANRLLTLLTACISLGLVSKEKNAYSNAPGSASYLVRGAPQYFGDYYRFQIDRQVYPLLEQLDASLAGKKTSSLYELVENDKEEAEHFSRAQHSGSLGPAHVLAKSISFQGCRSLLDVAGGSGAFSIKICQRHPDVRSTILDFPSVIESARTFVAEAGLESRIDYVEGNALEIAWPRGCDVVLMSYLLSAVPARALDKLIDLAFDALEPGGKIIIHDFMVADDRTGPTLAALWFVALSLNPEATSLTPSKLRSILAARGFTGIRKQDLIPGITGLTVARKPSGA